MLFSHVHLFHKRRTWWCLRWTYTMPQYSSRTTHKLINKKYYYIIWYVHIQMIEKCQKNDGHLGFWRFSNIKNINILFPVNYTHLDIMKDWIKSMFYEVCIKKYDTFTIIIENRVFRWWPFWKWPGKPLLQWKFNRRHLLCSKVS
jgi:hypothetical protein